MVGKDVRATRRCCCERAAHFDPQAEQQLTPAWSPWPAPVLPASRGPAVPDRTPLRPNLASPDFNQQHRGLGSCPALQPRPCAHNRCFVLQQAEQGPTACIGLRPVHRRRLHPQNRTAPFQQGSHLGMARGRGVRRRSATPCIRFLAAKANSSKRRDRTRRDCRSWRSSIRVEEHRVGIDGQLLRQLPQHSGSESQSSAGLKRATDSGMGFFSAPRLIPQYRGHHAPQPNRVHSTTKQARPEQQATESRPRRSKLERMKDHRP